MNSQNGDFFSSSNFSLPYPHTHRDRETRAKFRLEFYFFIPENILLMGFMLGVWGGMLNIVNGGRLCELNKLLFVLLLLSFYI